MQNNKKECHKLSQNSEDIVSEPILAPTLYSAVPVRKKKEAPTLPFPPPAKPSFTFIDLFAGIGGFRIAMQRQGGVCVFSSEWDKFAQKTYLANYGELPYGDITLEATKAQIPAYFDILCGGFPCQPFSLAGVSKNNSLGRAHGFHDQTQGTLFFDIADILDRHRPKAFLLENVKNLANHDRGRTFRIILDTLEELNYNVYHQVLDGQAYVPQHRQRIFIIGFNRDYFKGEEQFSFPIKPIRKQVLADILEEEVEEKYTLSDKLWSYLQEYAERHRKKGNGFGYGLADLNSISRTLSARYHKDGSEILIPQGEGQNPRKLTPRECARLMGYPDHFIIDAVSDTQLYRQMGNSVVLPLMTDVAAQLVDSIKTYDCRRKYTYLKDCN